MSSPPASKWGPLLSTLDLYTSRITRVLFSLSEDSLSLSLADPSAAHSPVSQPAQATPSRVLSRVALGSRQPPLQRPRHDLVTTARLTFRCSKQRRACAPPDSTVVLLHGLPTTGKTRTIYLNGSSTAWCTRKIVSKIPSLQHYADTTREELLCNDSTYLRPPPRQACGHHLLFLRTHHYGET